MARKKVQNQPIHESDVDKEILQEANKMVEFGNVPKGLLERILQRLNQESGEMQIEVPEDYLTLHDLRLSPIHLRRKMHIGQRLDLFENKMGGESREKNRHFSASEAQDNLQLTRDSIQSRLWNKWLWKLQAKFGSTTASFFNFMRWMIVLNFFNALLIIGKIPNRTLKYRVI